MLLHYFMHIQQIANLCTIKYLIHVIFLLNRAASDPLLLTEELRGQILFLIIRWHTCTHSNRLTTASSLSLSLSYTHTHTHTDNRRPILLKLFCFKKYGSNPASLFDYFHPFLNTMKNLVQMTVNGKSVDGVLGI